MVHCDILFETDRFNVSEVKEHFINPCCFGEDLAGWLRQALTEKEITTWAPGQEDWGWYLFAERGSERYFLGVGGYRKEGALNENDAEWRIMVRRRRTIWDRLRGRNQITDTDPMLSIIEGLLGEQTDVRNITRESL
jgi:hypothetical protein